MQKTDIRDSFQELEARAGAAGAAAARHERAKQGQERLTLQKECADAGGHVYELTMTSHVASALLCRYCGHDERTQANTTARNLGTAAPMKLHTPTCW